MTDEEREWIEQRFLWLRQQFGEQPLRREPIAPGSPVFPERWVPSLSAADDLFRRLCAHMLVDPHRVQLSFYDEPDSPIPLAAAGERETSGPAGLYIDPLDGNRFIVGLRASGLERPCDLAATMCHELAHVHLLGDRRISRETEDSEPLTDLLTIYFGCGIFTANSAFQFQQWQSGNWGGWSTSRLGYLSEPMLGYALAAYTWLRGEPQPVWPRHLQSNITYYFHDAIDYLLRTGKTRLNRGGG